MNQHIFSEWLCRQGYQVVRSKSSYWVEVSPFIFQAFPYHWTIYPTEGELRSFCLKHRVIGLRYSTAIDALQGTASYHVVYNQPEYLLTDLPKKARYDVNRALKHAHIEPISFRRLAEEGWHARFDTLSRQGRIGAENPAWWKKLCLSADGLPGFETWAAIVDGKLAASLIAFTSGECCSILYQQSCTEYLPIGVNNALTFAFTSEVLSRKPGIWLFYGLHSLDAPPSVDEFKFRMRYRAKPVRQRVVFHSWISPAFNGLSHRLLKAAACRWPGNPMLAKAEGMVRFYLEGKKPLAEQQWPRPLLGDKDRLLANLQKPSAMKDIPV